MGEFEVLGENVRPDVQDPTSHNTPPIRDLLASLKIGGYIPRLVVGAGDPRVQAFAMARDVVPLADIASYG